VSVIDPTRDARTPAGPHRIDAAAAATAPLRLPITYTQGPNQRPNRLPLALDRVANRRRSARDQIGGEIMKVYTYSQARRNLAEVLDQAKSVEVLIRRRGGGFTVVRRKKTPGSPFDVPSVKSVATTSGILEAVR